MVQEGMRTGAERGVGEVKEEEEIVGSFTHENQTPNPLLGSLLWCSFATFQTLPSTCIYTTRTITAP